MELVDEEEGCVERKLIADNSDRITDTSLHLLVHFVLHLVDLKHELIIVLLALFIAKVERLVEELCYEGLARPRVTPNIDALQILQVLKELDRLVTRLLKGVHRAFAHLCMHLRVVAAEELARSLLCHLLCILSKVSHCFILLLKLDNASLLTNEFLLPLLKHVDDRHLVGVRANLLAFHQLVVDFEHAILWFYSIIVNVCERPLARSREH